MEPPKGQVPTFENRNDIPTVYFDIAPAYGVMSGIVQIELGARVLVPHQDDSVDVRFVTVGRLRCSATAADPSQECAGCFSENAGAAGAQSGWRVETKLVAFALRPL